MKFDHYADLFIEFKEHELKPSTFDKYQRIVESRLLPFFQGCDIETIRPSDVKRWLYSIDDVGSKSKRHYLGVLSGIFKEAYFDEVIERNPVDRVKLPSYSAPDVKPFIESDVHKIIADAENYNYRHYLAVAFYTGMRSGEIIGLKKVDVNLDKGFIHVERSRSKHGEHTPKTSYSVRDVPVLDILVPFLVDLIVHTDNDYLFVNQYGNPYRDTHVFVDKFWRPSLEKLNIEYRRLYNTRHTYATMMLSKGFCTPQQLAQILGHRDSQMLHKVYARYLKGYGLKIDRGISVY